MRHAVQVARYAKSYSMDQLSLQTLKRTHQSRIKPHKHIKRFTSCSHVKPSKDVHLCRPLKTTSMKGSTKGTVTSTIILEVVQGYWQEWVSSNYLAPRFHNNGRPCPEQRRSRVQVVLFIDCGRGRNIAQKQVLKSQRRIWAQQKGRSQQVEIEGRHQGRRP